MGKRVFKIAIYQNDILYSMQNEIYVMRTEKAYERDFLLHVFLKQQELLNRMSNTWVVQHTLEMKYLVW